MRSSTKAGACAIWKPICARTLQASSATCVARPRALSSIFQKTPTPVRLSDDSPMCWGSMSASITAAEAGHCVSNTAIWYSSTRSQRSWAARALSATQLNFDAGICLHIGIRHRSKPCAHIGELNFLAGEPILTLPPCGVEIDCIDRANWPGRPVFTRQYCNLHILNETLREKRIEIAHTALIEIEHTARFKRTHVVDLNNQLFSAACDESVGRLVEPAVAHAAKLVSEPGLDCGGPFRGIIQLA